MYRESAKKIAENIGAKYKNKNVDYIFNPSQTTDPSGIDKIDKFKDSWYVCDDVGNEIDFKKLFVEVNELTKKYKDLDYSVSSIIEKSRVTISDNIENEMYKDLSWLRDRVADLEIINSIPAIAICFSILSFILSVVLFFIK